MHMPAEVGHSLQGWLQQLLHRCGLQMHRHREHREPSRRHWSEDLGKAAKGERG